MNRRDFLDPRRVSEAAGHLWGGLSELSNLAITAGEATLEKGLEPALLRFSRRAMATTFEVVLPLLTPQAQGAAEAVLDLMDTLEDQLTVYRETSEISRLNSAAWNQPVAVEKQLFELLERCQAWNTATENGFDISTGSLIKAWGFFRGPKRVPTAEELRRARFSSGFHNIALNSQEGTVRFLRDGIEINLGSVGKGYALDRAADCLKETWGINNAVIQGGHSSIMALGKGPDGSSGWPIGVKHPWSPEKRLATVWLSDRAMGTSAATFQHLEHQGRKLGHVLDPRTGWPAQGIANATVVAPSAAEADAMATAFYVLGIEKAKELCAARPQVSALLLADGSDEPVLLNFPAGMVSF